MANIPNPSPEEIRAFRLAAGLTLQQAGELLHSGKRSWEDWESGRRRMHPAFWELARIKFYRPLERAAAISPQDEGSANSSADPPT